MKGTTEESIWFDESKLSDTIERISEFLKINQEVVSNKIKTELDFPGITVKESWNKQNPTSEKDIINFYKTTDSYLYDLSIEHNRNRRHLLRNLIFAELQKYSRIQEILDFGAGIGTDASFFESKGYDTTYFDLKSITSDFAKFLFKKNNNKIKVVTEEEKLEKYDVIICFEVLEHLSNPVKKLDDLFKMLKNNGLLFVTESFELVNEEYPEHLEQNKKLGNTWKDLAAEIGFTLINEIQFIENKKIFVLAKYKPVDIILSVHNAANETQKCVDSILKHWIIGPHRLLVTDDGSTDSLINPILRKLDKKKFVVTKRHEKSLGLIKTENEAIVTSSNDVIFLNSDTVVTKNWLQKLIEVAYTDNNIGTVTPISNNATIYSWPKSLPNEEEVTIEELAEIVESKSLRIFPKIPVGVGFCIYIKREVFDKIGLLDEETFGFGYGEENDLCLRALKGGYRSVLADNTFIFHKGGSSFTEAGLKRKSEITIRENEIKLQRKHPNFTQLVNEFQKKGIMYEIKENLNFWLTREIISKRPRVMYQLHNRIKAGIVGGTEMHVENLVDVLRKHVILYVVCGDISDRIYVQEFVDNYEFEYFFHNKSVQYQTNDQDYRQKAELIFDLFKPTIFHLQHIINSTLDFLQVAKERKIPTMLTIHDYYLICPNYTLINAETKEFCHIPEDMTVCERCLGKKIGIKKFPLTEWRNKISKAIVNCDMVIYPSVASANVFHHVFYPKNEIVIPHGIDEKIISYAHELKSDNTSSERFSVAFVGYMAPHKGSELIKRAVPLLLENNIDVHFIGPTNMIFPKNLKKSHLFLHGKFDTKYDLIRIIKKNNIKMICLLSPWPETYSFILTEAWNCSVPVIVSPYGALAERVNSTMGGITLQDLDVEKFVGVVSNVSKSPEQYKALVENVKKIDIKSIPEMKNDYWKLYSHHFKNFPAGEANSKNLILNHIWRTTKIIADKERDDNSNILLDTVRKNLTKTDAQNEGLPPVVWSTIETIFPDTKIGKIMKFTAAFFLHSYQYGMRNTIKRGWKFLIRKQDPKN